MVSQPPATGARPRARLRFLAILFVLPLLTGCAVDMGNYGPGGAGMYRWRNAHTGDSYGGSEYSDSDHKWHTKWIPFVYPAEHTVWRGALTGGVTYGSEETSLTGTSDRTPSDAKRIHSDVFTKQRELKSSGPFGERRLLKF